MARLDLSDQLSDPVRVPVVQVWRADARGQSLLDSGGSIDARSLRRTGSTISWRNGSKILSATLK